MIIVAHDGPQFRVHTGVIRELETQIIEMGCVQQKWWAEKQMLHQIN